MEIIGKHSVGYKNGEMKIVETAADLLLSETYGKEHINDFIHWAPKPVNDSYKGIIEELNNSVPTDDVILTYAEDKKLINTFFDLSQPQAIAPCDIILEGTIPIEDLKITVMADKNDPNPEEYRIKMLSDYKNLKDKAFTENDQWVSMAAVLVPMYSKKVLKKMNNNYMFIPIYVNSTENFINPGSLVGYTNPIIPQLIPDLLQAFGGEEELVKAHILWTLRWYCIQCALLNPITEIGFTKQRNESKESYKVRYSNGRKSRYVRKVYLDINKLRESVECDETGKRVYKCNCWRVIGHWRHYKKTGKTIFIKGYWKGRDRLLRKDIQTNDRELVYED